LKNIILVSRERYENQDGKKAHSHFQTVRIFLVALVLLGSTLSCTLGNTSHWKVDGKAMEPNFSDGQFVQVESLEDLSSLKRGDVIIFEWNETTLLKRLIGLPGETVEIREGSIYIDGKVYDEPYEVSTAEYEREPIKLGEDDYYVLGDNRNDSRDSHQFGPITSEMIIGRVLP
jgi:signal peptidase I